MIPIDKFNLDKYVKEEDDLLEYVEQMALKYCPDINEDGIIIGTQATFMFMNRYNQGKVRNMTIFDSYWSNEDIQEYLALLNIDPEKFWYLLLFLYDYTWGKCMDNLAFDESGKQQIEQFSKAVFDNYDDDYRAIDTMKLTLSIGKKRIVIDKEAAIIQIAGWCNGGYEEVEELYQTNMINKQTSISALAYYYCNMFIDFFTEKKVQRKDGANISNNEKGLLCHLLFLTQICNNRNILNYRLDNYSTLKGFLYPKRIPEFKEINNYY